MWVCTCVPTWMSVNVQSSLHPSLHSRGWHLTVCADSPWLQVWHTPGTAREHHNAIHSSAQWEPLCRRVALARCILHYLYSQNLRNLWGWIISRIHICYIHFKIKVKTVNHTTHQIQNSTKQSLKSTYSVTRAFHAVSWRCVDYITCIMNGVFH